MLELNNKFTDFIGFLCNQVMQLGHPIEGHTQHRHSPKKAFVQCVQRCVEAKVSNLNHTEWYKLVIISVQPSTGIMTQLYTSTMLFPSNFYFLIH